MQHNAHLSICTTVLYKHSTKTTANLTVGMHIFRRTKTATTPKMKKLIWPFHAYRFLPLFALDQHSIPAEQLQLLKRSGIQGNTWIIIVCGIINKQAIGSFLPLQNGCAEVLGLLFRLYLLLLLATATGIAVKSKASYEQKHKIVSKKFCVTTSDLGASAGTQRTRLPWFRHYVLLGLVCCCFVFPRICSVTFHRLQAHTPHIRTKLASK